LQYPTVEYGVFLFTPFSPIFLTPFLQGRLYYVLPDNTGFLPKICAEESLVRLYIYLVIYSRGYHPLPPGTKYGFRNFEPKIYAEESLVRLYIYSVSVVFLPGLSPLTPRYKIWI